MKVIYKVPTVPVKRCVPLLVSWNWFFNRRPRNRY